MEMFYRVQAVLAAHTVYFLTCGGVAFGLILASLFVARGNAGGFLALASLCVGAWFAFSLAYGFAAEGRAYAFALFACVGGICYLCALSARTRQAKIALKAARFEAEKRRLQFALPDQENPFVQERLTSLLRQQSAEAVSDGADLRYAKKLLSALLAQPLSAAERLQAEDVGKTLAVFMGKPQWKNEDLRTVNDTLSALLKLCAKHAVPVQDY